MIGVGDAWLFFGFLRLAFDEPEDLDVQELAPALDVERQRAQRRAARRPQRRS